MKNISPGVKQKTTRALANLKPSVIFQEQFLYIFNELFHDGGPTKLSAARSHNSFDLIIISKQPFKEQYKTTRAKRKKRRKGDDETDENSRQTHFYSNKSPPLLSIQSTPFCSEKTSFLFSKNKL